ncbi:hypothetical protein KAR91_29775, partial [Candidatus Pacearchaeota archaeon]|nr:hypothetical protein [Candidatus Pacearchaeota archaeon]
KLFDSCNSCREELDNHKRNIFFIDGYDEKEENIDMKLSNLFKLEEYIKGKDKISILLTTRGLKEFTENIGKNGIITNYEIRGLTLTKIISFLEKLCKELNIQTRIIEDIKKSDLLNELPRSPIAAILLARLFENNSKDLPANLPELYSMYIELVLGKWDIEKGLESLNEYEIVQSILFQISYYFIDNQCNYITYSEYQEIIENYIESRNIDIDYHRIDLIIIKRTGVLIKDKKKRIINFAHRSFIEFMYAKGKTINNELKVTDLVFNITWSNIYYFYIGIKKDCEAFIQKIVDIIPQNESEKWLRIINLSNFFLAARSTPYRFFQKNLYKIFIEAAELYIINILKEKKSIFSKVPQLLALWWVQLLIKENYGYDFFKKALIDSTLIIDDSEKPIDIKIYSLFFLGTVGLRLDIYEPLQFLLTKYKEQLPSDITIGIKSETQNVTDKSLLSSKKWLDRKVSRMHKHLFKELTETPIDKQKNVLTI